MERRCIMCGRYEEESLVILDTVICRQCEEKMITPDVNDTEYNAFINKLSSAIHIS